MVRLPVLHTRLPRTPARLRTRFTYVVTPLRLRVYHCIYTHTTRVPFLTYGCYLRLRCHWLLRTYRLPVCRLRFTVCVLRFTVCGYHVTRALRFVTHPLRLRCTVTGCPQVLYACAIFVWMRSAAVGLRLRARSLHPRLRVCTPRLFIHVTRFALPGSLPHLTTTRLLRFRSCALLPLPGLPRLFTHHVARVCRLHFVQLLLRSCLPRLPRLPRGYRGYLPHTALWLPVACTVYAFAYCGWFTRTVYGCGCVHHAPAFATPHYRLHWLLRLLFTVHGLYVHGWFVHLRLPFVARCVALRLPLQFTRTVVPAFTGSAVVTRYRFTFGLPHPTAATFRLPVYTFRTAAAVTGYSHGSCRTGYTRGCLPTGCLYYADATHARSTVAFTFHSWLPFYGSALCRVTLRVLRLPLDCGPARLPFTVYICRSFTTRAPRVRVTICLHCITRLRFTRILHTTHVPYVTVVRLPAHTRRCYVAGYVTRLHTRVPFTHIPVSSRLPFPDAVTQDCRAPTARLHVLVYIYVRAVHALPFWLRSVCGYTLLRSLRSAHTARVRYHTRCGYLRTVWLVPRLRLRSRLPHTFWLVTVLTTLPDTYRFRITRLLRLQFDLTFRFDYDVVACLHGCPLPTRFPFLPLPGSL